MEAHRKNKIAFKLNAYYYMRCACLSNVLCRFLFSLLVSCCCLNLDSPPSILNCVNSILLHHPLSQHRWTWNESKSLLSSNDNLIDSYIFSVTDQDNRHLVRINSFLCILRLTLSTNMPTGRSYPLTLLFIICPLQLPNHKSIEKCIYWLRRESRKMKVKKRKKKIGKSETKKNPRKKAKF